MATKRKRASSGDAVGDARGARGHKQKMAALEPMETESTVHSALADELLSMWSWGELSAIKVQRLASKAMQDGLGSNEIKRLAGLGNSGAAPNNCHRDLLVNLGEQPLKQAVSQVVVKVPVRPLVTRQVLQSILLPHELFACLWANYNDEFISRFMGGSSDNVEAFWKCVSSSPFYNQHPVKNKVPKSKIIPVSLHGDGVAVTGLGKTWGRSCDCWSWCSLLGQGSTIQFNFLIYLRPKLGICPTSVQDLWVLLAWSFKSLSTGLWPSTDHLGNNFPVGSQSALRAGKQLANGYSAVLWSVKGDLDYYAAALGLNNPNAREPCVLCRANSSSTPWTACKPSSTWLSTIWDNNAWMSSRWATNPVLCLPDVGIQALAADLMHVKHLGTDQWYCGGILAYICGLTENEEMKRKLEALWDQIQGIYKDIS